MPSTRRLAVLLAVCLAVALAGCSVLPGGGTDVNPDDYDAQQLQTDAVAATGDASSYSFTFDQEITASTGGGSLTLGVDATGTADESARRTAIDLRTWIGTESAGVDAEAYHVDDALYHRSNDSSWNSTSAASGYWSPASGDVALLEGADVEIDGADSVDGQGAVVLAVEPSDDASLATYGLDQTLVDDTLRSGVSVQNYTVRQYVSASEPHRILRTEVTLTFADGETTYEGSLTTTYDYGGGDDVELPDSLPN